MQAARPTAGLDTRLAPAEPRRAALTRARGRAHVRSAQTRRAWRRGARAQGPTGGRVTPPCVGAAARAAHPASAGATGRRSAPSGCSRPAAPTSPASPARQVPRGPHPTRGLDGVCHQHGAAAAAVGGCGVVRAPRLPPRTPVHSPQEPRAAHTAVGHAGRPHRGPHVPADVGCAGVNGAGGCAAAVAPDDHTHLAGWHPQQGNARTDTPTAERLLHACPEVSLTILTTGAGEDIVPRLTPFSALQQAILHRRGLATSLSRQLEIEHGGN